MAYPQDHTNDPMTGSADAADRGTRSDPRGEFRRDVRSEMGATQSAAIERDIDRTRSRMDRTVEDLADRLRPSNIVSDLLDWFASDDGTRTDAPKSDKVRKVARRAGRSAWDVVRDNPMPSALIAGGIAWMFLKGRDDDDEVHSQMDWRGYRQPGPYGDEAGYDAPYYGEYGYQERSRRGEMAEKARNVASGAMESAKHAASWVSEKAGEAAGAVGEAVSSLGQTAGERSREVTGSAGHAMSEAASRSWEAARHGMSRTAYRGRDLSRSATQGTRKGLAYSRDRMDRGIEEYPLAMAAASLAAGVLAGLAVPRTRREDRLFGEYAHDLKHRASDTAGEVMHRARLAAEREGITGHTLKDQAKDLGRKAGESAAHVMETAVAKAGEAAREVAQTAKSEARQIKDEARDRGLDPKAVGQKVKHVAKETAGKSTENPRDELGFQPEGQDWQTGKGSTGIQ